MFSSVRVSLKVALRLSGWPALAVFCMKIGADSGKKLRFFLENAFLRIPCGPAVSLQSSSMLVLSGNTLMGSFLDAIL